MRVSKVMTHDPVCCLRTTGIRAAAALLRQFDIGFLPVIDDWETRRLIGVVTDRDICLLAVREEYDPNRDQGRGLHGDRSPYLRSRS